MKRYFLLLISLLSIAAATARTTYPLNEGWRFFFKSETSSDNARIVTTPHNWSGSDTDGALQSAAVYLNDIFIPADWSSKRVFMKFYGVQNVADLFVNGRHSGEHRGGATAFTIEITDKLKYGAENQLRVDVSNTWQNDVLPTSTDMNLYGGIYREVELIVTDKTTISPLYFGSDGVLIHPREVTSNNVEGDAEVHLLSTNSGTNCTVTLEITTPDGYQAFIRSQKARAEGKPITIPFSFEEPMLWSPFTPSLYTFKVVVESDGSKDAVVVRTGFREIKATPQGGFRLNGERVQIKGVALGHDNGYVDGAYTSADYDTDISFVQQIGANAIRSLGAPHAPYLYDRCDQEGILVWIDLPFQRSPFLSDVAYLSSVRFEDNGRQQLREMIAQHINHPSVVMWGIFSGLWTRDDALIYLRSLNATAHKMDPSRPTVACSNQDGDINFITDLIVWQQNVGWDKGSPEDVKIWSDMMRKNWSRLCSAVSYGAEGITGQSGQMPRATNRTNWLPEGRQSRFHEGYAKHLDRDSLFWGVWINNLFDHGSERRTYGINASGLVTRDRRECKDAFYLYKMLWNKQSPTLRIADKGGALRAGELRQLRIYSQQRPTLRINSDTVALREWAPGQYRTDSLTIGAVSIIKAEAGDLRDSIALNAGSVLKARPKQGPQRRANLPTTN